MNRTRLSGGAIAVLLAGLTAGCATVGPDFSTPTARLAPRWLGTDDSSTPPPPFEAQSWWMQLHDPDLTRLVERALANNPTLEQAGERVLAARAELARLTGERFPQEQVVTGGATRAHQSVHAANYVSKSPTYFSAVQTGLTVGWELDFWGSYRRAIESGRASLEADTAAYEEAKLILAAQVASTYITIRTHEAQLEVTRANIVSQTEGLAVAQARFNEGESAELDLRQASTQLAETQAQLPTLEATIRQARDALAVLLGTAPGEADGLFAAHAAIPTCDTSIAVGIPRDLLRDRPDVRQAEQQAAAQSAQIGVAKAALYPSFSLGGTFGYSASNVGTSHLNQLFRWDSRALQYGPSFNFPLFNYGRLEAEVRVQSALFRQSVLAYQTLVLQAQQETEDARAALSGSLHSAEQLEAAAAAARRTTELAMIRYREGATDYTTVLTARQSQLRVESELTTARGTVPQAAVSLFRALGGGWQPPPGTKEGG
jgi:NodT family efflux transporter outer membrane factor (OMF) lipoprotein